MTALPPLREVIARHGLDARKQLGQHFLLDGNLTDKIARAAGDLEGRGVLEIGPGPGGLTRSLLAAGARVVAVETDARCLAALAELEAVYGARLRVVHGDALDFALADAGLDTPLSIVANLPYNIATPLLFAWLDELERVSRIVVMVQKEVAQRICAAPGGKAYGRLAVMVQAACRAEILFHVPAAAFTPPPRVTSSVLSLIPRSERPDRDRMRALSRTAAVAFNQRRKMLRGSLGRRVPDLAARLAPLGLADSQRPETLSVADFLALADAIGDDLKDVSN